jgi:hypothetical protein
MQIHELGFFALPQSVRKALGLLAIGWLSLLAFMYHIHLVFPGTITRNDAIRVAIVGAGICYCVFKIKPWARNLCIFFNLGAIGISLLFLAIRVSTLGLTSPALTLHALLNVMLFGGSTVFLLASSTSQFFKARLPKDPQQGMAGSR